MSEPLVLVVPGWTPDSCLSLNGRRRAHWHTVRGAQSAACEELGKAALAYGMHRLPRWERARVTIELVYPTRRRRDLDGLAGLAKPLLDTLVLLRVVPDDDSEHLVELTVRPTYERGERRTTVTVVEVLK